MTDIEEREWENVFEQQPIWTWERPLMMVALGKGLDGTRWRCDHHLETAHARRQL